MFVALEIVSKVFIFGKIRNVKFGEIIYTNKMTHNIFSGRAYLSVVHNTCVPLGYIYMCVYIHILLTLEDEKI